MRSKEAHILPYPNVGKVRLQPRLTQRTLEQYVSHSCYCRSSSFYNRIQYNTIQFQLIYEIVEDWEKSHDRQLDWSLPHYIGTVQVVEK